MRTLNEILEGLATIRDQNRDLIDDTTTMLIYQDEVASAHGWDKLKQFSEAYAGSPLYLMGRNGMIYSRVSGTTMTLEDAVNEFTKYLRDR